MLVSSAAAMAAERIGDTGLPRVEPSGCDLGFEIVGAALVGSAELEGALDASSRGEPPPLLERQELRVDGLRSFAGGGAWATLTVAPKGAWAIGRHRFTLGAHLYRFKQLAENERPALPSHVVFDEGRLSGGRLEVAYGYDVSFGPRPAKLASRPRVRPMLRARAEVFGAGAYTKVDVSVRDRNLAFTGEAAYRRFGYEVGPRLGLSAHLADDLFFDFGAYASPVGNQHVTLFAGMGVSPNISPDPRDWPRRRWRSPSQERRGD